MDVRAILPWNVATIVVVVGFLVVDLANDVPPTLPTWGYLTAAIFAIGLLCVGHFLLIQRQFAAGAVLLIVGGLITFPLGLASTLAGLRVFHMLGRERQKLRERRRCLKCGYDLTGLTKPRCPECGCLFGFTQSMAELGIAEDEVRGQ